MADMKFYSRECIIWNFVVLCVYVGTGKLSNTLATVQDQASPIWAPSGVMVAVVLTLGYNVWIGGFLGNMVINFWYFHNYPAKYYMPSIVACAVFSTLEALICGWLLNHPVKWKHGRIIFPPQV